MANGEQNEYMYDDYLPEESLYDKYREMANYPYNNSAFIRGASDKMNYEARELLNPDDPYLVPKVVGTGMAPALGYGIYKVSEGLNDIPRALVGGGLALATQFAPDPTSEKIYSKKTEEPNEDGVAYRLGKQAVPAVAAYGMGKAFQNGNAASALPYLAAPVFAGMMHPSFSPFANTSEDIDRNK